MTEVKEALEFQKKELFFWFDGQMKMKDKTIAKLKQQIQDMRESGSNCCLGGTPPHKPESCQATRKGGRGTSKRAQGEPCNIERHQGGASRVNRKASQKAEDLRRWDQSYYEGIPGLGSNEGCSSKGLGCHGHELQPSGTVCIGDTLPLDAGIVAGVAHAQDSLAAHPQPVSR